LLASAHRSATQLLDELLPPLDDGPIEDLVAIVAHEIGRERALIENLDLDRSTPWEIGLVAVQVLAKTHKAVAAIENAYCNELRLPCEVSHVAETETALDIRLAYTKFRSAIDPTPPFTSTEVEQRLRTAATAIARLRGRRVFLDLRPLDRRLLLKLHRRIQGWLRSGGQSEPGAQLWQDLWAFTELLAMINHRAELIEFDARAIPELQATVATMESAGFPLQQDQALLQRMGRLCGRCPEFDRLVSRPETTTGRQLFEVIGRMEMEMLCGFAPWTEQPSAEAPLEPASTEEMSPAS
ncbi:MAG: hypothetical protein AAFX50_09955, partial [Acidobacteriota bacterium]